MHLTATVLSGWARVVKQTLDASGCDSVALFRQAGLDPAALDDPDARYPVEATTRLWRLAVAATGDTALGLKVASRVRPPTFHALGYALTASASLKDAFERIMRFCHIVTDAADHELIQYGGEYHFLIRPSMAGGGPAVEAVDSFVSVYVRMCRSFVGRDYSPLRIEMQRPVPADVDEFRRVLRTPLVFGAVENRLVFDRESFEQRLDGANSELARYGDEISVRYLARFEQQNIRARLESILVRELVRGEPTQDGVARALNMSARSLQRRLAEAGTSYTEVLDATRREMALSYLRSARYRVSEVTYLLGFSSVSSFTRAFRRWTGVSPTAWRSQESPRPDTAFVH